MECDVCSECGAPTKLFYGLLAFCVSILLAGKYELRLDIRALQTLAMVTLVFGGEATLYAIRERRHLWASRRSGWVIVASIADVLIISALAIRGIAMQPLPVPIIASIFSSAILFVFLMDMIKVPVLRRLQIV